MKKYVRSIQVSDKGMIKITHYNGYVRKYPARAMWDFGSYRDTTAQRPEFFDREDIPFKTKVIGFTVLALIEGLRISKENLDKQKAERGGELPLPVNWLMDITHKAVDCLPPLPPMKMFFDMEYRDWVKENENAPVYLWVEINGKTFYSETSYDEVYHKKLLSSAKDYSIGFYHRKYGHFY